MDFIQFPQIGHCLEVLSDKTENQLQEVWTYFNVVDVDKFVFTRCVECNGNSYIQFSGKIALAITKNLTGENRDDSGKAPISEKCPTNEEEESPTNNCDMANLEICKGIKFVDVAFPFSKLYNVHKQSKRCSFFILRFNL